VRGGKALRGRYWLTVVVIATGLLVSGLGLRVQTWGQSMTHTAEKGDTLWDICEKYYGDPNVWPKLWQMNPFITNPHLIKPGDIINLLEDVPLKAPLAIKKKIAPPVTIDRSAVARSGIDVSGFTNVEAIGFLSTVEVAPWGRISSAETERVLLSKGETVYVTISRERHVTSGHVFTVYQISPVLTHAITAEKLGYVVSFLGRIVLKEQIKELIYRAEIIKSFRDVHVGDLLLPYEAVSACLQPVPVDRQLSMNIVAVKDLREIIGQFSIVYFDYGYKHGIRRGNFFEIVKEIGVKSPKETQLLDVVMGHILILEARPDTATGVVVATKQELSKGTIVRSLEAAKAQQVISMIPRCPVE
jgi:hypothetical protein